MITQVVPGAHVAMPWMMCNTNAAYTFSNPDALAIVGADLGVADEVPLGLGKRQPRSECRLAYGPARDREPLASRL